MKTRTIEQLITENGIGTVLEVKNAFGKTVKIRLTKTGASCWLIGLGMGWWAPQYYKLRDQVEVKD